MVFMLKIRWTAWQDQMLACMVDKYHKAKYQMAQKMISMTASEDMLTKEKNLVRGSERKYTTLIKKYYIDNSIVQAYKTQCYHSIIWIVDKSGNETTSDSDGQ